MKTRLAAMASLLALCCSGPASAQAVLGQPAPAFTAMNTSGQPVSLADYKGKYVVLEWFNPGCPFVRKHYDSGNMPATQKNATGRGVVWLSINSTSKEASDYQSPTDLSTWQKGEHAVPSATLMDADGKLGRAYGARATPHLFIVDPKGALIYAGAIDSKPSANPADIKTATNYVDQALGEALAGKPVSHPASQAYGCSVKYSSAG